MTNHNSDRPELRAGLILAGLHYKIVPIGQGQKYPPIQKWQEAATDDLDQVAAWLTATNYGVGWAMGLQPNGKHLFCVDVDGEEGVESLMQLLRQHGDSETFDLTCQQLTGSGGFHYVFEAPYEIRNSAKQFAPSVDIRGEGGQIVCGPTIHPNGTAYRWLKGPKKNPPQLAPQWVLDRIAEMAEPHPQVYIPGGGEPVPYRGTTDEETPMEWLNRTFDGFDALMRLGWKEASRRGEESQMVRPGKEVREGTGGTYHHDTRVFNVYSTGIAPEYGWVGKSNRDGSIMLLPADLWMVENGYRSVSEASSVVRKTLMPRSVPAVVPSIGLAPEGSGLHHDDGEHGSENPPLNLPDEFWNARPMLSHIRQAAHHEITSPDAVFAGIVARYAAMIPPSVQIPSNTLDIFFVTHGPSGSGKSSAGSAAARTYTRTYPQKVMLDQNVGSGEGLAEAFYEWQDEKGDPCGSTKKGATKVLAKWGMHFATDEGQALAASAGRMNSILIPTLCQAWMGEPIGQRLADPTKSRMIGRNRIRMTAEIRIQTANGYKLFQEEYATTGLSQRMICLSAQDPTIAAEGFEVPAWPGELDLPVPYLVNNKRDITYCPEITADLLKSRRAAHGPGIQVDPLDTHLKLAQLKLASILCLWEDRIEVSLDDMALAEMVVDTHKLNRSKLQKTHAVRQEQARVTRDTLVAQSELTIESVKEAAVLAATVERILTLHREKGTVPKKGNLSRKQQEHWIEARSILAAEGKLPPLETG